LAVTPITPDPSVGTTAQALVLSRITGVVSSGLVASWVGCASLGLVAFSRDDEGPALLRKLDRTPLGLPDGPLTGAVATVDESMAAK
jgi:hypothetical protein